MLNSAVVSLDKINSLFKIYNFIRQKKIFLKAYPCISTSTSFGLSISFSLKAKFDEIRSGDVDRERSTLSLKSAPVYSLKVWNHQQIIIPT